MSLDDRTLDGVLAEWAAAVRLPADAAAGIYQRIIATPAPDLVAVPLDLPPARPDPAAGLNPAAGPDLAAGPGLDPAWWRTFTADFTERLVASTRPRRWAA